MEQEEIKSLAAEISKGVLSRVGHVALFFVYFNLEYALGANPTSRGAWQAYDRAFEDLEQFDIEPVKRAFYNLKSRGLIETVRDGRRKYKITAAGKKRLESLMPVYDEERVWDGKLYLVTYDIPEEKKSDREILREYLKKIGCGMLQKSVWLTVYDPSEVLREFIESRELIGSALVSCLGKDGNIGRDSIKDVVGRVFNLKEINQRYLEYLDKYGGRKKSAKSAAIFDFLSILRDDPQLPFGLLPGDWVGKKVYNLYKRLV